MNRQTTKQLASLAGNVIWLAATALLIASCSQLTKLQPAPAKASLYERVTGSGKIRCGYLIYTPGCMKDLKTGKMSGIGPDVLSLAAKRLGLELEWTEEVGL